MAAMLWAVLASALPLAAQESGIDQGLELIRPPGEPPFIRWQTKPGRTYFVQVATQAAPLQEWYFTPFIEVGEGQTIDYQVPASAEIGFFRLKYTDLPLLPGVLPEDANPDDDDLTSEEELLVTHTDPLEWDTDGDGLSDGWEHHNGLDPNDPFGDNGADGDPDHDGLLNSEERVKSTKPNDADSDNDGITDGSEINQGTLPNDPNSTPAAEWFVLTGDYAATFTKSRSRTITIPKGQCRMVAVMLASDEFPEFTDPESENPGEFNDILTWNITGGNLGLNGRPNVNSLHEKWIDAELNGVTYLGFPVVYFREYQSVQAPSDADLVINIALSASNVGDIARPSTVMVGILPIDFETIHTEKERDLDGNELTAVVTPGEHVLLRDEIADLRIKVPSLDGVDWNMTLDLEPAAMKTATLGARGAVQMYDIGRIENETVIPLTAAANGTTISGPYAITLPGAEGGQDTFRIVVNNEGAFRLRLKTVDNKVDVSSQEFTVNKRIRKYARTAANGNADFDKHDPAFQFAAGYWGAYYDYSLDPDIPKAMGMQESSLGYGGTAVDILTINKDGQDLDHVLAILRKEYTTNEKEAVPDGNGGWSIGWLDYDDAAASSAPVAIFWGTCWLYHKAQKGRFVSAPDQPPHYVTFAGWNSWDIAIGHYGPNPVYLGVIEGPWKRGRRDSTTGKVNGVWAKIDLAEANFEYLWPILSTQRPRK